MALGPRAGRWQWEMQTQVSESRGCPSARGLQQDEALKRLP